MTGFNYETSNLVMMIGGQLLLLILLIVAFLSSKTIRTSTFPENVIPKGGIPNVFSNNSK
jgi:hypothetical protein